MSDLIDRQAAIEWVNSLMDVQKYYHPHSKSTRFPLEEVIDVLQQVPSAQPERKKGRWIIKDDPKIRWYKVTCSECGEDETSVIPLIGFFPNVKPLWDYCPNCGARMEVEDDH